MKEPSEVKEAFYSVEDENYAFGRFLKNTNAREEKGIEFSRRNTGSGRGRRKILRCAQDDITGVTGGQLFKNAAAFSCES